MTTHLAWFRHDLRPHNNLALAAACRDRSAHVLALYIPTPEQWKAHDMTPRQVTLVNAQLNALQTALAEKGIPLLPYEVGDFTTGMEIVENVCVQHGISRMFYNCQYEINERQCDAAVEKSLPQVVREGSDDSVILPAGTVMIGNHEMYEVFTPFKNAWLKRIKDGIPECVSASKVRESGTLNSPLTSITLGYPQQDFDSQQFPAEGELTIAQLYHLCQQAAEEYKQLHDFSVIGGTSRLSMSPAIGELSPHQRLNQLLVEQSQTLEDGAGNIWLSELIWCEFYRHLVIYHPVSCRY